MAKDDDHRLHGDADRDVERSTDDDEERAVRCARCGHALTRAGARCELHGRHAHTFMNPSGVIFAVRLYTDAPGARHEGVPDSDTSWFPRTAWTYALCGGCGRHVGWRYVDLGDGAVFWGLIADSISE